MATGTYGYDDTGRLTDLTYTKGTTLVDYDWVFDAASRITQYVNSIDGSVDYTNDDTGQLTGADYDYQTDEAYTYDDNGNRVTANGETYVTGDNNQLLSDGTYRYAYDDEGNRILKFIDTDSSGTLNTADTDITEYEWDYRNRLTSVEHFTTYANYDAGTSDQIVAYDYDAFNRLIGRTLDPDGTSGATSVEQTVYIYNGDQIALQFDKTGTGDLAAGDLSHRYLWGQAVDQILADETVDDGGAEDVLWALTDHLNTVRDLVSYDPVTDTTTPEGHITYDAYGNVTNTPAVDILFGYTGRLFDEDTGLQNNLNRWYDAEVGRWLSEDPIGFDAEDANLYRYCNNESTNKVDPNGLEDGGGYYLGSPYIEDEIAGLVDALCSCFTSSSTPPTTPTPKPAPPIRPWPRPPEYGWCPIPGGYEYRLVDPDTGLPIPTRAEMEAFRRREEQCRAAERCSIAPGPPQIGNPLDQYLLDNATKKGHPHVYEYYQNYEKTKTLQDACVGIAGACAGAADAKPPKPINKGGGGR